MNNIIITFHNELNYGAILQAYALQEYLKNKSTVEVLNLNFKLNNRNKIIDINWLLSLPKRIKFNNFLKRNINLTKKINTIEEAEKEILKHKNVIVGSDQVWAFDLIKKYEKIFYLDMNLNGIKKISYAASFGKDSTITENLIQIQDYLSTFNKISVREESSAKILNKLGISCNDHIDPTFLLTAKDYIEKFDLKKYDDKYILVYMLVIDEELINLVKDMNKILNYKIICFNKRNRFGKNCKCYPNASPQKFLELMYNASFIITNSFHGTCFSIIFNRNFITVAHKQKGNRQINLLKKANLMDRLYNPTKQISDYLKYDYYMDKKFEEYINNSKEYLDNI